MTYTLNANDVIVDIQPGRGDEWLAKIPREKVIGTPLLSHVTGVSTAAFIRGILDGARRGHRVDVPYRCDTADRRRSWMMEVVARDDDCIIISHRLLEDLPLRSAVTFQTATAHLVNAVPRCSVCNRVFMDSAWRDPDEHVPERFWPSCVVDVIYEICSSCDALARPMFNI